MDRARRASLALGATTLVWGSTFIVQRELFQPADPAASYRPFLLLGLRFSIAAAVVGLWVLGRRLRISRGAWVRGIALGAITAGGFATQAMGAQYTTASRSAYITNISLLFVPLFGMGLGRPRPPRAFWAGCLLAMGGLYLLEFPWDASGESVGELQQYLKGDLLTLGCAVFFACQILATESFSANTELLPLVFVQFAACGAIGWACAALTGQASAPWPLPAGVAGTWARVLFLALIATAVCLLVQAWAQRAISATRAALIFLIEPVVATVLACAVLAERFTFAQAVGAVTVFGGICISEFLTPNPTNVPRRAPDPESR
jgi:drug/metabolite transporter (DMT)-like permease